LLKILAQLLEIKPDGDGGRESGGEVRFFDGEGG
jgi:hypothetical protein